MPFFVIGLFAFMMYKTYMRPIVGLAFMWFAIWLYPNNLMYGTVPGGIRFDDLFVVVTFLICLYKKPKHISLWNSAVFRLAFTWWLVHLIGNLNGYLYTGGQSIHLPGASAAIFKFLLKSAYIPMTVAAMVIQIHTFDDVKYFTKWVLIAGACTAIIGVGTVLFPDIFSIFLLPDVSATGTVLEMLENSLEIERRARGSLGIVGTSIICPFIAILALYLLIFKEAWSLSKTSLAIVFILTFFGLIYTQSRGPLLGLGFAMTYILFRSKSKNSIIILSVLVALLAGVLVTDNPIRELIFNRFTGGTDEDLSGGVDIREHIWQMFIEKLDPVLFVNGMGMMSAQNIYAFTAHNTYLGSLVYGGIWGVMQLIAMLTKPLRLFTKLAKRKDALASFWGGYIIVALLFMMFIGMSIEVFQQTIAMQVFFSMMMICEKVYTKKITLPMSEITELQLAA